MSRTTIQLVGKCLEARRARLSGALALLGALVAFPTFPTLAQVSCEPVRRGTLGDDGVFTRGTQASDTDYRFVCRGTGPDTNVVSYDDVRAAEDLPGADEITDAALNDPDTRIILEVDNAVASFGRDEFPDVPTHRFSIVVLGEIEGDGASTSSGVSIGAREELVSDLAVDSHADIHMTGGAHGINVWTNDQETTASLRVRNFGQILTEGELPTGRPRGRGIDVYSRSGDVELSNEAGASVETRGDGGRGLYGSSDGDDATVAVVNRGSIVTTGDPNADTGNRAYGAYANIGGRNGAARATNEATGTIVTRGVQARGLRANACVWTPTECDPNASPTAIAINRGSIVTHGEEAHGIDIHSEGAGVTAEAINDGGSVVSRGDNAFGIFVGAHDAGATARAINEGSIRTEGNDSSALRTWLTGPSSPSSEAVNRASGQIETFGLSSEAVLAVSRTDGSEASTFTGATNEGTVVTHGTNADAVVAVAVSGGTEAHPASVRSINRAGATIETEGDGASGLNASIIVGLAESGPGPLDAFGTASAENHGTIRTAGGVYEVELARGEPVPSGAPGVIANFWPWEDTTEIGNTGDVTVVNTGEVTVTGGSAGLSTRTFGTGRATVRMSGGSVTAGVPDDGATAGDESGFGIGIHAAVHTDSTSDDPGDDTDVSITVSGSTTTVTAHGAAADDPATDYWDESRGIGIHAQTGATGHIEVEVSGGATINADRAGVFEGGRTTFTLDGSTLVGDLEFAGLDDHLTVRNALVDGDVLFGEGMDTLVLDVPASGGITGRISGLENLVKRGAGLGRIFDAEFSGSALDVEDGELLVAGHLDLGGDGTLTVHDPARLTIEVGDLTEDLADHGRITAGGGVVYEGLAEGEDPAMYLQLRSDVADDSDAVQMALEATPIDVLGDDSRVRVQTDAGAVDAESTRLLTADADGASREIGSVGMDGEVTLAEGATLGPPPPVVEPPVPESGGSRTGALALGGGALLAAILFSSFDDDEMALADRDEAMTDRRRTRTSFGGLRSGHALEHRVRTGGFEQWTRAFTGDSPAVSDGAAGTLKGVATGLDARLAGGFRLGATAMPELSLAGAGGPASGHDTSLEGSHYSLRGGWSGASLFADAAWSQGRYRARTLFENPAAGGVLGGEHGLARSQVRGRVGARLGFGRLRAAPSLSLFSGTLRQGAYTAESAALRAEVPGLSQRYDGWKARLDLAPASWLEGPRSLRWRPSVHLASTRTRTHGPAVLEVSQADKAGVLGFSSRAGVHALPRTVHGFGAGVTAMRSEAWRLRLGYAGMVVDGDPFHAAVARLRVRF